LLALALGGVVFGSTYALPQLTQGVLGFTPTLSGELFIVRAVPIALLTPLIVQLAGKVDTRWLLGIGFVAVAAGSALQGLATTSESAFWTFGPSLILTGAGSGMLFVPISIAVLGATTPQEGPKAGAMVNLSLQLGGSIAVAALDVVLDRRWALHSQLLTADATLSNPNVHDALARGLSVPALAETINAQAAVLAYADATFAIALLAAAATPLVFMMRKPKAPAGPVEAAA
jgi:DHA2 family multidrug resistance protein